MQLPTDRGYVAITELKDGTKRVDVFARRSASGLENLFATHTGCPDVHVSADVPFERRGAMSVSTEVVAVSFDPATNRLHVADPAATTATSRLLA